MYNFDPCFPAVVDAKKDNTRVTQFFLWSMCPGNKYVQLLIRTLKFIHRSHVPVRWAEHILWTIFLLLRSKSNFHDSTARLVFQHIIYHNLARVLSLYKSYWAAMNKIFIYARLRVNKMTWAFFFYFTWLQNFSPVKLQCGFLLLKIRKKPAMNCPIFKSALTF